ncbi:MAG: hypothetical protein Q4Q20_06130 [Methanocorpusculum sp.]|nr:hypothetical protein [Methanocorpusculum sp.]
MLSKDSATGGATGDNIYTHPDSRSRHKADAGNPKLMLCFARECAHDFVTAVKAQPTYKEKKKRVLPN